MSKDKPKTSRVAVGLSGGVDSALSAALLVEQGYQVTGVFLECWRAPGCRTDADRKDALDIALNLGIPFEVLDFKAAYRQKVVDYFYQEYRKGRTPNPDVACNREIKFGLFYDWAMGQGFDYVATGHYARIAKIKNPKHEARNKSQINNSNDLNVSNLEFKDLDFVSDFGFGASDLSNSHLLLRGIDPKKDQSYFLYQLLEEQLPHILFPIGHLTKTAVRLEAKQRGLHVSQKPDSQGICFIGQISTRQFLKDLGMKEKQGQVLIKIRNPKHDSSSVIRHPSSSNPEFLPIGTHQGAGFYTIGQRHGFTLNKATIKKHRHLLGFDPEKLPPLYITGKDAATNTLIIGTKQEALTNTFTVSSLHWINQSLASRLSPVAPRLDIRIRHGGALIPASITQEPNQPDHYQVTLDQPVFGAAPGQAAVIYQDEIVLGGGIIS